MRNQLLGLGGLAVLLLVLGLVAAPAMFDDAGVSESASRTVEGMVSAPAGLEGRAEGADAIALHDGQSGASAAGFGGDGVEPPAGSGSDLAAADDGDDG